MTTGSLAWLDGDGWEGLPSRTWDDLAACHRTPAILSHGWFRAWREAFATDRPVCVPCLWECDGRTLRAALPLVGRRGGTLSIMYYESLGEPLARTDTDARELGRVLATCDAGRIALTNMSAESSRYQALHIGLREGGARVTTRPAAPDYRVELLGSSYEDFERRGLSANARRQIRKLRRRMERDHSLRLRPLYVPEPDDYLADLERFFEIERQGWKGREESAILADPNSRRYHESVCGQLAGKGLLRYSTLEVDGLLSAFDFGVLERDHCLYSMKTSYLEEFAEYAPGNLLRASIVAAGYEQGLRANSLGSGTNRSKERFATSRPPAETLVAYPRGFRGAIYGLASRRPRFGRS